MNVSRRTFVGSIVAGAAGLAASPMSLLAGQSAASRTLAHRFPDLARHFVFEYYPWYGTNPYRHWNEAGRRPPVDLASNFVPKLGAYDSRSTAVMEQHARWIKDSGAGAINVSWWGRDSDTDRVVPALMDVMAAHDIRVTFHLEPYRDHRGLAYADDVEYLIKRYGDGRRWDAFLLLTDADGAAGPVFKSFRTILPPASTDCRGRVANTADYTADAVWREQTDRVRATFGSQFGRMTLLADSLDTERTRACGFDGIAVYDNYLRPDAWRAHAEACTAHDLVFSFNVNPGFDGVVDRRAVPESCYRPPAFEPDSAAFDWASPQDLVVASRASERRIRESFDTTIALQTEPALADAARGFLLVYLNSFNEWHEGHQFEPMKDRGALVAEERAVGYHNPENGRYRLDALAKLLAEVLNPR
jgi:hypothetical protein